MWAFHICFCNVRCSYTLFKIYSIKYLLQLSIFAEAIFQDLQFNMYKKYIITLQYF